MKATHFQRSKNHYLILSTLRVSMYFKYTPKNCIICTDDVIYYNLVHDYLILTNNEQVKFHTYMPKSLKPYNVFIRYLYPPTTTEDIIQVSLTYMGHEYFTPYYKILIVFISHRFKSCQT